MAQQGTDVRCENCPIRRHAESKPNSIVARFWKWHTTWCPGWKAYQEILAERERSSASFVSDV
jgi:hypothetical protein